MKHKIILLFLTIIMSPSYLLCSETYTSIIAGAYFSNAIRSDGTLWYWGRNNYGEAGNNTINTAAPLPIQVGSSTWTQVVANTEHTKAINSSGELWVWGRNSAGQLGLGNQTAYYTPQKVSTGDTKWYKTGRAFYHSIGIQKDGSNYTLWTWGCGEYGQLGDGGAAETPVSCDSPNVHTDVPTQVGSATNWSEVAGGVNFSVAISSDGKMWATGRNDVGQLGVGDTTDRETFTQVGSDTNWSKVSCGVSHCIALKSTGTLWIWGYNPGGILGTGDTSNKTSPTQLAVGSTFTAIGTGQYFSHAVKSDGTLWGWGDNPQGQLGVGDTTTRTSMTQVGSDTTWKSVSGGLYHTIASKTTDVVWIWGDDAYSQLGDYATSDRTSPAPLGTVYYVDYTGGDNTNAGTSTSTPWKNSIGDTAQATGVPASKTLAPGDKVIFKGGVTYTIDTYNMYGLIKINASGNSDNDSGRIIYDGDSGTYAARWGSGTDKAKLDGNRIAGVIFGNWSGYDYLTFNNFEVTNMTLNDSISGINSYATYMSYTGRADYITVSNCNFHDLAYHDQITGNTTSMTITYTSNPSCNPVTISGVSSGKPYIPEMGIKIINQASGAYLTCKISAYDSGAGTITTKTCECAGTAGTYSLWDYGINTNSVAVIIAGGHAKVYSNTFTDLIGSGVSITGPEESEVYNNTLTGKLFWPLTFGWNDATERLNNSMHDNTLINIGQIITEGVASEFLYAGGGHQNWLWFFGDNFNDPYTVNFSNLYIYNNKMYNTVASPKNWGSGALHMSLGGDAVKHGTMSNIYIYNNVVFNVLSGAGVSSFIQMDISKQSDFDGTIDNINVFNNTCYVPSGIAGSCVHMIFYDSPTVSNIRIKNNNFYMGNGSSAMNVPPKAYVTGTYDINYNNYYVTGATALTDILGTGYKPRAGGDAISVGYTFSEWQSPPMSWDTNGKGPTSDPLFTAVTPLASFDLSLQAGSPAGNNGVDLSVYFTTDILGTTRTGAWDIGAYESISGDGNKRTIFRP